MTSNPDFVAALEAEARSPTAIFHEFRLSYYGAKKDDLFLFFEGLDDKLYYIPGILRFRNIEQIECFICDGKRNVLAIRQLVENEIGDSARALFFIDRDFDALLNLETFPAPHLYVTDSYSFENTIVGEQAVRTLWGLHTPYGREDARSAELLISFERAYQRFVRVMRPVTAWCLVMRQEMRALKLSGSRLAALVRLEGKAELRKLPGGFDTFRESCGVIGDRLEPISIRRWIERLANVEPKVWLSGKFELWFFTEWLKKAWKWLEYLRKERGERRKLRCPQLSFQGLISTHLAE